LNANDTGIEFDEYKQVQSVRCAGVRILMMCFVSLTMTCSGLASADEDEIEFDLDGPELSGSSENASNPLAAVNNTDIRWQYNDSFLGEDAYLNEYFIDGAFMFNPKLKFKYELHYWDTNVSGTSESGWESAVAKLIYFPHQGIANSGIKYRIALGVDYIHDLGHTEKGIGLGADQIGPFGGIALAFDSGLTLIPLLQHFTSINGADINTTAVRLIAIQPFGTAWWLKVDTKVPYDWENKTVPADVEIQLGKNINSGMAFYADGKFGLGSDRLYDWGFGLGLRFNY